MPLPEWMIDQEAVPLPPLVESRIHVMGIAGRGLAPLAGAASLLGASVTGCDSGGLRHPYVAKVLEDFGLEIIPGHGPDHLCPGDRLIATAAARVDNPEVAAARADSRLHRRMDLAAAVMAERPGIGVTGSHGKGTVAALTAAAMARLDPLAVLGVHAPEIGGSIRPGKGPSVMEIDDSDTAAHFVTSDVAVVTSLEGDHPHLPTTLGECVESIGGFVRNARELVILGPSRSQDALATHATVPVLRIGKELKATTMEETPEGSIVRISGSSGGQADALIRLVGGEVATNAAIAYASARFMGISSSDAVSGLETVTRLHRRLEPVACPRGIYVYDDFGGKHPSNVRAGLQALRRRHPAARIVAIFEPVFASTVQLWGWRYSRALSAADEVILMPAYEHADYPLTTGDPGTGWHTSGPRPALEAHSIAEAASLAASVVEPGDVVVGFIQIHQHGLDLSAAIVEDINAA